ncbi:MAG: hypothetical protein MZV70_03335 [Desulfobacterales bacterium]|nr:hypothetical protein [Desulfobacterales bacterium]
MSVILGIFIVTAFAFFIAVILVIMRAATIGDREAEYLRRRIIQDYQRERLMGEQFDDTKNLAPK